MERTLLALAEEFKPKMVDFCQQLIRIPALPGEEKELADLYMEEMSKLGYDEVFRDDWGNVVGIIKGNFPGPRIMFNGHLDHVDTGDISEWGGYDPYGGLIDISPMYDQDMTKEEATEVIHGRAASDVKGGGAAQVYAGAILLALREKGVAINGDYVLTMTVLEEPAEMLGMIKLMEETLPKKNISIQACVSCEATSLKLYLGHRGRMEIKVEIQGVTAHGSSPWLGINAVNMATRFIDRVEEIVEKEKHVDPDLGKSSIALTVISCSPGALCIVPDRCQIIYDRRFPPTETVEGCLEQVQRVIDELSSQDPDFKASVTLGSTKRTTYTGKSEVVENKKPGWKMDKKHPVVAACAAGLERLGQPVKYGYWDFGTDLPVTQTMYKIPSIGYSPMQEYYCHRSIDKVRIDYMEKALAGNVAIFLELIALPAEAFTL